MSNKGRILVMEDEERWREVLGETLQRGDFHVDLASTTTEARDYIKENYYHLFVLDIRMKGEDISNTEGMALLNEVDSLGLSGTIKIIMLSAYGTREQMRHAFRQHAIIDFLDKQEFDNEKFLEYIQQILQMSSISSLT